MSLTVKDFENCYSLSRLVVTLAEQNAMLRSLAESTTSRGGGQGGNGGGKSDKVGNCAIAIIDLIAENQEDIEKFVYYVALVKEAIYTLDDADDINIMEKRYVLGKPWGVIANEMDYSEEACYKRHKKILQKVCI